MPTAKVRLPPPLSPVTNDALRVDAEGVGVGVDPLQARDTVVQAGGERFYVFLKLRAGWEMAQGILA
jgi:hypothetical protein